jgi:hypothetical protein
MVRIIVITVTVVVTVIILFLAIVKYILWYINKQDDMMNNSDHTLSITLDQWTRGAHHENGVPAGEVELAEFVIERWSRRPSNPLIADYSKPLSDHSSEPDRSERSDPVRSSVVVAPQTLVESHASLARHENPMLNSSFHQDSRRSNIRSNINSQRNSLGPALGEKMIRKSPKTL